MKKMNYVKTVKILVKIVGMYKIEKRHFFFFFIIIFLMFFYFLNSIRVLDISFENYNNTGLHIMKIGNGRSFWLIMIDVQKGLCIKNISDLVRKKIHDTFTTKNSAKEQIRKYKRSEKEWFDYEFYIYFRSDLMSRIIKNCRGEKGKSEKKKKRR